MKMLIQGVLVLMMLALPLSGVMAETEEVISAARGTIVSIEGDGLVVERTSLSGKKLKIAARVGMKLYGEYTITDTPAFLVQHTFE